MWELLRRLLFEHDHEAHDSEAQVGLHPPAAMILAQVEVQQPGESRGGARTEGTRSSTARLQLERRVDRTAIAELAHHAVLALVSAWVGDGDLLWDLRP